MVEYLYQPFKTALICNQDTPWADLLPTVLTDLRMAFKDDLQASPTEILFGATLRISGEFFASATDQIPNPLSFVAILRSIVRAMKTLSIHITTQKPFTFKDLHHVFKYIDPIWKPPKQLYTGPHKVIRRINDHTFVIAINASPSSYSTDTMKPAVDSRQVSYHKPPYHSKPPNSSTANVTAGRVKATESFSSLECQFRSSSQLLK